MFSCKGLIQQTDPLLVSWISLVGLQNPNYQVVSGRERNHNYRLYKSFPKAYSLDFPNSGWRIPSIDGDNLGAKRKLAHNHAPMMGYAPEEPWAKEVITEPSGSYSNEQLWRST